MLGAGGRPAQAPAVVAEDPEVWRWLLRLEDGAPSWQGPVSSMLERVRVMYASMRTPQHSSKLLEGAFHESVLEDREAERAALSRAVIKQEPVTLTDSTAPLEFTAPVGVPSVLLQEPVSLVESEDVPYLEGDASKCLHVEARLHNVRMRWVRHMRANGSEKAGMLVKQLVPASNVARELRMVHNSFKEDEAGVAVGSSQRVLLTCPYSRTRMRLPARGASCVHLSAFDLETWAEQVTKERCPATYWKCPLCSEQLSLANVYVSSVLSHILATLDNRCRAVVIDSSGRFGPGDTQSKREDIEVMDLC